MTRLVNADSGGNWIKGAGDILDSHTYPNPRMRILDTAMVNVLGEYGGIGRPVEGHTWEIDRKWGYVQYDTEEKVTDTYCLYAKDLIDIKQNDMCAAAVYTQTTDVEGEVNGFYTYDREILKADLNRVREANQAVINAPVSPEVKIVHPFAFHYKDPDCGIGNHLALYALRNGGLLGLDISYRATTDKATPVNLSNHAFYNLHGSRGGTILDHVVTINADTITPVDDVLIPTGDHLAVDGTPFDFRQPHAIGERIGENHEQLLAGGGYDHNWELNVPSDGTLHSICTVSDPVSGRVMEILTDQPGLQFYSGNFFDGSYCGKVDRQPIGYREAAAFCHCAKRGCSVYVYGITSLRVCSPFSCPCRSL